jgi:hypothetical protein
MSRAVAVVLLVVLGASAPAAADGPGDGLYDRFDRDLTVALVAGGGVVLDGVDPRPTLVAELRSRIIASSGPMVALRWSGGEAGDPPNSGRGHLLVGVEIRPFFPAIFLLNLSLGHEWWDLFLQSFAVEVGAALFPFDDELGVGLGVGLSIELPLLLPSKTSGAFQSIALRVGVRRVDGSPAFQGTPDSRDASEWTLMASLSFALSARLGVADWEPPRYRLDD